MDLKTYTDQYRQSDSYNTKVDDLITNVGFILPIPLAIYGFLVYFNLVNSFQKPPSLSTLFINIFIWVLVGLHQKIKPGKTPFSSFLRLAEFHIAAAVYLLSVSGIFSPIIIFLPILMAASYIYFNKTGIKYSVLFYAIIFLIDIFFIHQSIQFFMINLAILLAAITTSGVFILINRTNEVKKQKILEALAQESLQREQITVIINNLTDAVMSVDRFGNIKIYNSASLSLFNTNKNLTGSNINDLAKFFTENDKPVDLVSILNQSKKTTLRDDIHFFFKNTPYRVRLSVTFAPIRNLHTTPTNAKKSFVDNDFIIIFKDITQAKNLEEERDEFVSVISHELRAPVAIAEGTISNIQVLLDKKNLDKKILKNSLDIAYDHVIFLSTMINDISALSRVEHGQTNNSDEVVVEDMINRLINRHNDEAKKKKLKLEIKLKNNLGLIKTNSLYLEELLQNFITNAIKYTEKGSITVIAEKQADSLSIKVKDTGIGINKNDQEKLFQKFFRSNDDRTQKLTGTGLGLYVSSKLARKIGAIINLESEINKGSTFEIKLALPKRSKTTKGN